MPVKNKKRFFIFAHYALLLAITVLLSISIYTQNRNHRTQMDRAAAVEAGVKAEVALKAGIILAAQEAAAEEIIGAAGALALETRAALAQQIAAAAQITWDRIQGTNTRLQGMDAMQEQFPRHTEILMGQTQAATRLALASVGSGMSEMKDELGRQISAGTALTGERLERTNSIIQQMDLSHSQWEPAFLSAAEYSAGRHQRTLESLYAEPALMEKEEEAWKLFNAGNYTGANAEYTIIARERPENSDARFYQWYSLFLANRMNRDNYLSIKEGLEGLERYGYSRVEIREVLEFIAAEEGYR